MTGDQDFLAIATEQANPTRFFGPTSFDRTHQFSFGTIMNMPGNVLVSFIGHFNSPLPTTLVVQDQSRAGEIFHTDFTGDGTVGDICLEPISVPMDGASLQMDSQPRSATTTPIRQASLPRRVKRWSTRV
jgi:hypothetical protein